MTKLALVRGCIQAIHCSGPKEFIEIFGHDMGAYLFNKYTVFFDRREDSFICYLDNTHLASLILYVEKNPENYK